MSITAGVLILVLAVAALCVAALGWKTLVSDRRLRSAAWWRDMSWALRVFITVAVLIGAVGGIWLGAAVQDGKETLNERAR